MEPIVIVALISGTVGIITGVLTFRATRLTNEAELKQAENKTEIDSVQFRLDHWTELVAELRTEIDRKNKIIELEQAKNQALRETVTHLRDKYESGD